MCYCVFELRRFSERKRLCSQLVCEVFTGPSALTEAAFFAHLRLCFVSFHHINVVFLVSGFIRFFVCFNLSYIEYFVFFSGHFTKFKVCFLIVFLLLPSFRRCFVFLCYFFKPCESFRVTFSATMWMFLTF